MSGFSTGGPPPISEGYSRDPGVEAISAIGGLRAIASNKPVAGHFVGPVEIEGELTVDGVTFGSLAQEIQALEHQLAAPGQAVGGLQAEVTPKQNQ